MAETLTAHDRDKVLAIMKSLSASCGTQRGSGDHAWRKCRHCLAQQETDHEDVRELIRRFVSEIESAAVPHAEAPPTPKEEIAWLVALGSMPPQWWTGRGDEFTTEIDGTRLNPTRCAMRFARREDAERAIGWLVKDGTRDGCRAEEHLWL